MTPEQQEQLCCELDMFTGTTKYYQHPTGMNYTDGIHFLIEEVNCYWLLDAITSHQTITIRDMWMQVWTLAVKEDRSCVLTMAEDTGLPNIIEQVIPLTDFPLPEIKLWLIEGVLILPSEY